MQPQSRLPLPSLLKSNARAGGKPSLREAYDYTCAMKPNIMPNTGFFKQLLVNSHARPLLLFSVLIYSTSAPPTPGGLLYDS